MTYDTYCCIEVKSPKPRTKYLSPIDTKMEANHIAELDDVRYFSPILNSRITPQKLTDGLSKTVTKPPK